MNLFLLEPPEIGSPLPRTDRRVQHVLQVLRRGLGDTFDAGIVNGARGKARITHLDADSISLSFEAIVPFATPAPITLLIGLPRPQTARDVLRDATTLGVSAIHFIRTEKGESSYAQSTLWSSGEWRRHLLLGAEQAFDTHIPDLSHGRTLKEAVATLPTESSRFALDNYESPEALGPCAIPANATVILAIGPERGWSASERGLLRNHAFTFVHLGHRVLRTETAVIAALALVRAKLGLL